MKSIIIADDEYIIRTGLTELISKTGQYKILASCKNGQEAFEYTARLNPDIVITDIRMPVLDGIGYIKKCSEYNRFTTFVVISGYEDFKYAKSALQLKVYDYLLKPIDHNQLLLTLANISEMIDKERMEETLLHNQLGTLCLDITAGQEQNIRNLLQKSAINLERIQVAVIDFENNSNNNNAAIPFEAIKHEIDVILDKSIQKSFLVFWHNKRIVMILNQNKKTFKNIPSCIYEIHKYLENKFPFNCYIGLGEVNANINEIPNLYRQALYALSNTIYEEKKIIRYKPDWNIKANLEEYFTEEKSILFAAINNCDREKSHEVIESFFEKIFIVKLSPIAIYSFINSIINNLLKIIDGNAITISDICSSDFILSRSAIEKSKLQLLELIDFAINSIETTQMNHYGHFLDRIIKYLNSNYEKDLSLKNICKNFNINVSYFCKIFKEKTGKTFKQYMADLRISYAKDMLKHNNLKIYEVAEIVGFKDAKYFTKIFKKYCKMTPLEFKTKALISSKPDER